MAEIVPRWEWRTFGSHFGAAEPFFAELEPDAIQESDELYLLSEGEANVKIRDELVDVKALNAVDSAGLEQWVPVMKAEFPLASADLEKVYDALGIVRSSTDTDQLTQEQLLEELGAEPAIRAVAVQKRRARHRVGGCTAEVTDLLVEGKPTRTIAVESEDPEAVVAAVELAGSAGIRQHQLLPRPPGDHRGRPESLCRHRCRDQLGQVPSRGTGQRWDLASRRRSSRGHPPRRGPARRWVDLAPSHGQDLRCDRRDGRRSERARRAGHRRGRDRRVADGGQRRRRSRRVQGALGHRGPRDTGR